MIPLESFIYGFFGSLAVEVVTIYNILNNEHGTLPSRYKTLIFWIVRLLLALMSGGLVMAYEVQKEIVAINIGASAPLILKQLAGNVPNIVQIPEVKHEKANIN